MSFFLNLRYTYGVKNKANALDVIPLVFVAFAPPLISFFGAAAVANAAEEVVNVAGKVATDAAARQELTKKMARLVSTWLQIKALQLAVLAVAVSINIRSRLARRLAPWLLVGGFIASLMSIALYGRFFSMVNERWWGMVVFNYIMLIVVTYLTALSRLLTGDG